jgi:hypothetical protein
MMRNQGLFVLNAFGAYRRPKSDSVSSINTPRVRTGSTGCSTAFALFGIPFAAAGIGFGSYFQPAER